MRAVAEFGILVVAAFYLVTSGLKIVAHPDALFHERLVGTFALLGGGLFAVAAGAALLR